MADDKRKKSKAAKSAVMINLSSLSKALSDDATVFSDTVRACSAKHLITDTNSTEYMTNTAMKTLVNRAASLANNIMFIVGILPEQLDTFLCILYDSKNEAMRRVAVEIANAYGYDLPNYGNKVAQDNDSIDGEAANPPPDNVEESLIKMVNSQSSSSSSITDDQLHRSALNKEKAKDDKLSKKPGKSSDSVHCVCSLTEDVGHMVECESCCQWSHSKCVGLTSSIAPFYPFVCPFCVRSLFSHLSSIKSEVADLSNSISSLESMLNNQGQSLTKDIQAVMDSLHKISCQIDPLLSNKPSNPDAASS